AGSINTALMTVIGEKKEAKSVHILKVLSELNFFNLVDGHSTIRRIIKKFISHHNFTTKVKRWFLFLLITGVLLFLINFSLLGFYHWNPGLADYAFISFIVSGVYFLSIGIIISFMYRVLKRLKNNGYGINPGNYFYDWIKDQLARNGVKTVSDLNKKATSLPKLSLRARSEEHTSELQ